MKKIRIIVLLLALTLVLQACSSKSNTDVVPSSSENQETVSLSAFSAQSVIIEDYDNNDLTMLLEEKFNVDIQWTLAPSGEATLEKQNLLLASGEYPDVFFGGELNQNDQIKYGTGGMLIPLNDLIDEYGPNIKIAFEQSPYILKGVTALDGNIYGLPGLEECYHCDYSQKMWINKEWLNNLNLPMPTTTDELYTTLLAFKDNDPNGNGEKDEIALSGCTDGWNSNPINFLMCSFIYSTDSSVLTLNNGKVDISANKPEWKEGLAYIRKLYAEGLIDPQAFTQNYEGLQGIADNPDTVIVGAFTQGCCVPTTGEDGRWTQYDVVTPLKGPNGMQLTGYFGGNVGDALFAITDKANEEQQIAAIKIVDYLFSQEGSLDSMYGPKDIGWWDPKPDELGIDGKDALYSAVEPYQREDKRSVTWDIGLKYTPTELFNGRAQEQDITVPSGYETFLSVMTNKIAPFKPAETFPAAIWYKPENAQQLAQIRTDINNYIKTNSAQFVIGEKNLDSDWNAYVEGFNGLGVEEYIRASQEAYDQQYKN